MAPVAVPYCGTPPTPAELLGRWNLDPILLVGLALVAALYALGARKGRMDAARRRWFYGGWALTTFALICPLCPLSVSLFAARVGQHMILTLLAAPIAAMGRPLDAFAGLARRRPTPLSDGAASTSLLAGGLFAAMLWYWHAPGPYEATFESTATYWLMHVTLYVSALWLWTALLAAPRTAPMPALLTGVASTVQMGLLGALITLSPRPVYAPHFLTASLWGLTPLQDQQVGGALMWAPGCLVFLAVAMAELWRLLEDAGAGADQQPAVR